MITMTGTTQQMTTLNPHENLAIVVSMDVHPDSETSYGKFEDDPQVWSRYMGLQDPEGRRLNTHEFPDINSGDDFSSLTYDEAFEEGTPELMKSANLPSWYEGTSMFYDPEGYIVLDPTIVEAHARDPDDIDDPGVFLIPEDKTTLVGFECRHPDFEDGEEIDPENLPQF